VKEDNVQVDYEHIEVKVEGIKDDDSLQVSFTSETFTSVLTGSLAILVIEA